MQLSEKSKKCMKFLSVKAVFEYAKPEISLETFYKALQGREFSRETIEKLEYAIRITVCNMWSELS